MSRELFIELINQMDNDKASEVLDAINMNDSEAIQEWIEEAQLHLVKVANSVNEKQDREFNAFKGKMGLFQ